MNALKLLHKEYGEILNSLISNFYKLNTKIKFQNQSNKIFSFEIKILFRNLFLEFEIENFIRIEILLSNIFRKILCRV